jgi:hypothetical protein
MVCVTERRWVDMARQQITGELFDYDWTKQRYGGKGCTLGDVLAETTDGVSLPLDTPQGDVRIVSLAPFEQENPDHFLVFRFIESEIGFDHLDHGNAVVLDEYELPADLPPSEVVPPEIGDGSFLEQYKLPPGTMLS